MPMFQQLRSTGYRKRSAKLPTCPNRTTIRTFIIPETFRLNLSNEPFLIHDSADPHRVIAFASKSSLKYLGMYRSIIINLRKEKSELKAIVKIVNKTL